MWAISSTSAGYSRYMEKCFSCSKPLSTFSMQ
jgi:hypothetical protein